MYVMSFKCWRKESGVSATTCRTRIRVYIEMRTPHERSRTETDLEILDKALEKSDEVLGLAYIPRHGFFEKILGEHYRRIGVRRFTITHARRMVGPQLHSYLPGLDTKASSALSASCRPSTSLAYSSWSFEASVFLILLADQHSGNILKTKGAHSSILSPSRITLRAAESSIGRVRSMLRDSMQTLSVVRVI